MQLWQGRRKWWNLRTVCRQPAQGAWENSMKTCMPASLETTWTHPQSSHPWVDHPCPHLGPRRVQPGWKMHPLHCKVPARKLCILPCLGVCLWDEGPGSPYLGRCVSEGGGPRISLSRSVSEVGRPCLCLGVCLMSYPIIAIGDLCQAEAKVLLSACWVSEEVTVGKESGTLKVKWTPCLKGILQTLSASARMRIYILVLDAFRGEV